MDDRTGRLLVADCAHTLTLAENAEASVISTISDDGRILGSTQREKAFRWTCS